MAASRHIILILMGQKAETVRPRPRHLSVKWVVADVVGRTWQGVRKGKHRPGTMNSIRQKLFPVKTVKGCDRYDSAKKKAEEGAAASLLPDSRSEAV